MRILHVTYSLAADQGGPTMVTTRVAAAQAGLGHEVTILTRRSATKETPLPEIAGSEKVRIERVEPMGTLAKIRGTDCRSLLRSLIAAHDVVHVHNIWDPILIHAVNEARRQKKPTVLSPHGILTRWALSEKAFKKSIAMNLAYGRAIHRFDRVHALSRFEEEEMRVFGWTKPIGIVPNGVFLSEIDPLPAPGEFRAKHPQLGSDPYILFLSRLHPIKGLPILVDAFQKVLARVPNARLVITGPDFGMQKPIEEQVARLGIADRVHLTGPIFSKDKYAAMVDSSCFCLPSGHEAFSVAIAEAMAARSPVVISEECHFPEAQDAGAGFVVQRTVDGVADGLLKVMSDATKGRAMGEAGRRLIEEKFTWEAVARALVEMYK
jgi:glycosyltransferase involved in cell wall biosynthesis